MAAAAVWKSSVLLTDLEDIHENLVFNIDKNLSTVSDQNGWIAGDVLDWTKPQDALPSLQSKKFKVCLCPSNPTYTYRSRLLLRQIQCTTMNILSSSQIW